MLHLTPSPFLGSIPDPDPATGRLAARLAILFYACGLVAIANLWIGVWLDASGAIRAQDGLLHLASATCLLLLLTALVALWAKNNLAARLCLRAWPVPSASGRRSIDLIETIPAEMRPKTRDRAMWQAQKQADLIASSLCIDSEGLADMGRTQDAAAGKMAEAATAAESACTGMADSLAGTIGHVATLAGSVTAVTAEIRHASQLAIGSAEHAFALQREVVLLDAKATAMASNTAKAAFTLRRLAAGLNSPEAMAASPAGATQYPAPDGLSLRDLLSAEASMGQAALADVIQLVASTAGAVQPLCAQVAAQQEIVSRLSCAIVSQGEQIEAVLRSLDQARHGVATLRESVEAVTRHGVARRDQSKEIRTIAYRLHCQADAVVSLLRNISALPPTRR